MEGDVWFDLRSLCCQRLRAAASHAVRPGSGDVENHQLRACVFVGEAVVHGDRSMRWS
jgi:hypothetical protein